VIVGLVEAFKQVHDLILCTTWSISLACQTILGLASEATKVLPCGNKVL